jgi:hypothetical protein
VQGLKIFAACNAGAGLACCLFHGLLLLCGKGQNQCWLSIFFALVMLLFWLGERALPRIDPLNTRKNLTLKDQNL